MRKKRVRRPKTVEEYLDGRIMGLNHEIARLMELKRKLPYSVQAQPVDLIQQICWM